MSLLRQNHSSVAFGDIMVDDGSQKDGFYNSLRLMRDEVRP